jgi:hypothetical protein
MAAPERKHAPPYSVIYSQCHARECSGTTQRLARSVDRGQSRVIIEKTPVRKNARLMGDCSTRPNPAATALGRISGSRSGPREAGILISGHGVS